jgi:chemotaxis protein MotB
MFDTSSSFKFELTSKKNAEPDDTNVSITEPKGKAKKEPKKMVENGAPKWVVLYGDLMAVMLVFFVLLFSMSTTDKIKYQGTIKSVQEALLSAEKLANLEQTDIEKLIEIKEKIDLEFNDSDMRDYIVTGFEKNGIRIMIKDSVFFRSGGSDLLPTAIPILNSIADAIRGHAYPIIVEGHTDDIPIKTIRFPSNWELSTSRASSVVRFFQNYGNIKSIRLTPLGHADNRPLVANTSNASRSKNRRVEIKILDNER